MTFFVMIINYVHNNLYKEKYNLILWFPIFQCIGILVYFSLSFEPSLTSTILISLSALIPLFILYRKCTILCIALIAVLMGFTASKIRTVLIDTKILDKERYVKNIIATVKDVNDKGLYKQFLLYEIKNTRFKLGSVDIYFNQR